MLKINRDDFELLRCHSEQSYPHECCGVLVGSVKDGQRQVHYVVRCLNTRTDSPHNRFAIEPRELVKILREARERGLDIIGFYHSHPDHPARWSSTDYDEAHWIGCCYVITAVANGKADQTSAFLLLGDAEETKRFADEALIVEDF